jgi:hypothetical protein
VLRSEGGCYEDEDDEDYVEKKKILKICYVLAFTNCDNLTLIKTKIFFIELFHLCIAFTCFAKKFEKFENFC